ncbi:MAG: hypothetical protein H6Q72_4282 [Firmicutes bacterium]|nr:hypothetical protein [Bacillota bacterium]
MAAVDFTTLDNVKQYLNLSNTTSDAFLSRLISAASAFVVTWVKRDLLSASYTEQRNGNGSCRMMLKNTPVTAVSSLTVNGHSIPASTQPGISPGYWFDDKMLYVKGYSFPNGFGNVTIDYTAGYTTVPLELEQVVIELVANKYKRRDRIGEDSKDLGGQTVSYSKRDLSQDHMDLLSIYKRVVPIV